MADGTTYQESSLCDGSDATIITNRACTVSITDLKAFTGEALNEVINVQVKIVTEEGISLITTKLDSTIVYQSTPTTYPVVATSTATPKDLSGNTTMVIAWVHLSDATNDVGYNDVTEYKIECKTVLGTDWTTITPITFDSSATLDAASVTADFAGLIPLTEYEFRISASNDFGYGPTTPEG